MSFSGKELIDGESDRLKKSKTKQKGEDAWKPEGPKDPFVMLDSLPEKKQQEIQKALHLFGMAPNLPKSLHQAKTHTYHFWDTQPVPKLGDIITTCGPIQESVNSIRNEPYSLPQGFSWDTLDLKSPTVLRALCSLLNENYMEEDDNTIRFDFSQEYLQWALQPPNWQFQWNCGVRVNTNKKLVGFIAAIPADVCIYGTKKRVAQVMFMCVHKKLRGKRMTPVLIRELTRRVNQQGLNQAVYTAGTLMEVNYPGLRKNLSSPRALKFNRLPKGTKVLGLRPMTKDDIPGIHTLLQTYLSKFPLSPLLSLQEVEHWLMPKENVIYTYVVEGDTGSLTDVVSFYSISYKVLNHPVHTVLRAAHLFYIASSATELTELMEDALVLAKCNGFDIFTALNVMNNMSFLEKLKFTISDNSVHYYLYNWMCPPLSPDKPQSGRGVVFVSAPSPDKCEGLQLEFDLCYTVKRF
ncbi:glycylpeptide N-tetradecanoyltransferase 1-like [Menidia menidia]